MITLGLVQTLGHQVVMPRFDPGRQLELTERYCGTVIGGVPTMLTALLAAAARARATCPACGSRCPAARPCQPELVRQVEAEFGGAGSRSASRQTRVELLDHV